MAADSPITFLVAGRGGTTTTQRGGLRAEASASDASLVELRATPGEDVVHLQLVNGPELVLHPETVRELLQAQARDGLARGATADDKRLRVPTRLAWAGAEDRGTTRGALDRAGQVVLQSFEVIKQTVSSQGANLIGPKLAKLVDDLVTPGLHALGDELGELEGEPVDLSKDRSERPLLVLVHGTFASTVPTFKRLWQDHAALVKALQKRFDLYAFEHATLGESPLDNALDLAKVLPRGRPLHFLTHSRGGLVVEALAQLAGRPVDATELAPFDQPEEDPDDSAAERQQRKQEYARQRGLVTELRKAAEGLDVRRVVRVACPARGTLLASRRLDAYLSVLTWGLKLAQVPVAPTITEFLGEVAKRRTKPQEMPGLEAMMPGSPFLEWLHHNGAEIPGQLRVVAGDLQGDSLVSWLKTLLSDAFYWTDNDLVVQTRSMYGGAPRREGSTFQLDRGGRVDHFNYFINHTTAAAVVRGLLEERPEEFQPIGVEASKGSTSDGRRGAVSRPHAAVKASGRPALILVPGMFGSSLQADRARVWPSAGGGLARLAYRTGDGVEAEKLDESYDALCEHLAESHEVIPFPFDWRKPVEVEAERLGATLEAALGERATSKRPVRMLAHSLGGLVVRALGIKNPSLWHAWMKQDETRLLLLGTPHGGCWLPMQVLTGDNLLGGALARAGTLFGEVEGRRTFAGMPGFLQLQAGLLDSSADLGQRRTWETLAQQDRESAAPSLAWHGRASQRRLLEWAIPEQAALETAVALQRQLQQQYLSDDRERILVVASDAFPTITGFEPHGQGDGGFQYLRSDRGDGTVTLGSALLPGVEAWRVEADHAQLVTAGELHAGYRDLLERGSTGREPFRRMGAGAAAPAACEARRVPRIARTRGWTEESLDAMAGTSASAAEAPDAGPAIPALHVSVVNGDLTFVKEPLLLGHYRSVVLSGAEWVIDRFLGGTMSQALATKRYPTQIEESEVFLNQRTNPSNPLAPPRPAAVIVVGLGPEGELRAEALSRSIRQGVIGYAQRLAEKEHPPSSFELASTFAGSGGLGVSVATSARAVVQGVRAANERLLKAGWPIAAKLSFVELYEDRAIEALRELVAAAERLPAVLSVNPELQLGYRPLPRPESAGYRGADYDYVSALDGKREDNQASIDFSVDTRRARTEVRASTTQLGLLRSLIQGAEADRRADIKLGKTLFRLLVPADLDAFFGDSEAVMLEVDDATASIPWEVLGVDHDDDQPNERPWSIRTKLVRKLRTKTFRENPSPAGLQADVLVIGDPQCVRAQYPELEGARREARAVASVLGTDNLKLEPNARDLVNALLEKPYSVVHIAGHGREDGTGVVMSDDQVLDADLVSTMRRVPDLVFVNCCHSGRQIVGERERKAAPGRGKRAATIASGLIRIGVRCVIAAGWAVDDDAAEAFARELYGQLLGGANFMDATSRAREKIWRAFPRSNTWAAYQCYGDPGWVMVTAKKGEDLLAAAPPPLSSTSALLLALKTVAARGQEDGEPRRKALGRLRDELDGRYGDRYGHLGEVAEAFAAAYSDLGQPKEAIDWYGRAVKAEKGDASYRSLEQLCNLRIRAAADQVAQAFQAKKPDFAGEVTAALKEITEADADLQRLWDVHKSYERANLRASSCKRRAIIAQMAALTDSSAAGAVKDALGKAAEAFRVAEQLARQSGRKDLDYPLLNRLTLEMVLGFDQPAYDADADGIREVKAALDERRANEPDFWVFVQQQELAIYQALCARQLAKLWNEGSLRAELEALHERIASPWQWASVRDQARLTLLPYRERSKDPAEQKAAEELGALLEGFAAPGPS